jgi:hypothetical protein
MESWITALVSAIASGSVTVIGAAIWFGRNTVTKDDLIAATATTTNEIHDLRSEIDAHGRNVGETISGIRQKITEVELYVRDTFVRRDSWHQSMNQLHERWAAGDQLAAERSARLEQKVDRIMERPSLALTLTA